MKVLLVTSNSQQLKQLVACLKELGCSVLIAETPVLAMARYKHDDPDVIICDWQIGDMPGLRLCETVRKDKGNADYTYFILLADRDRDRDAYDSAIAAGVDDFLPKPPDIGRIWMRLQVAKKILGYMDHIRELKNFIPICSYCKKIRDDKHYWQSLEGYLESNMDAEFELRVCPECATERGIEPENWEE